MLFIILLVVFLLLYLFVFRRFKFPKIGSMVLVSGGVKTGKSTFSVALAIKEIKRRQRRVKIKNLFRKVFSLKLQDVPLLYSNIPLNVPYVPIDTDLLLRKKRFVYGSVIYVCESSLVADSQLIKDNYINEQLLLFNKLIGHETKGGVLIFDTQSIADTHYSTKRCLSEYIYIHHLTKWLPFFLIAKVQENRYSEDGSILTINSDDVEENLKSVLIRKSTWKKFDCYCYSSLTDNLPVKNDLHINSKNDLKATSIVSFRHKFNDLVAKPKEDF